jgi:16S rRNA (cytosine967-C5)-methyltransferase
MVERWLARFGEERTVALLEANNNAPRLSVAVQDPGHRNVVAEELQRDGLQVEQGALLNSALSVKGGSVARTAAFREGRISIQDEASQAIPLLLDVHAGDRVLDLCAAPGGKTAMLARAAGEAGSVIAVDLHGHRLSAMHAQFARLGLDNVKLMQVDATQPLPLSEKFLRVLVDAPCSGTGTLARHPEIKWRLKPEQITEFHELQLKILRNAMAALAPGGRLVYSTCSLETEENELVVDVALALEKSVQRVPATEIAAALQPHLAPGVSASSLLDDNARGGGQFHTFPPETRTDGFFAAVIEKS